MKKFFLFISTLLIFSCAGKKDLYDAVRKTPKQKFIPPGTVWLRDNLFIDETEIENFSYLEFLYWTKRKEPKKYLTMYPDTVCWSRADVGSASELASYYLQHPTYRSYPVVGISYQQAVEFCKWRTLMVNQYIYIKTNKLKKYSQDTIFQTPQYVLYRLPIKEEWEYAAAAGLEYCRFPMGYESLLDKYGIPVSNTFEYYTYFKKDFTRCSDTLYVTDPTAPVYAGKPNKYGLYNMLGNVSEIISDSSCKGANFTTPIYSIQREETDNGSYTISTTTYDYKLSSKYKRPEPWLGFRCVCEVLGK